MVKSQKFNGWLVFLLGGYLVLRLANLMLLAPFHDEVVYIWLSKQFSLNPLSNWKIGFTDGKEPLFFWISGLIQKISTDSLVGGRLVSVITGLIGFLVFYKLARKLLNDWGVAIVMFGYVVSPFLLIYQRMALLEAFLTTLLIIALYQLVVFLEMPSLKTAVLLGVSFALPVLTKTNGLVFLGCMCPLIFLKAKSIEFLHRYKHLVFVAVVSFLVVGGWLFLLPQYHLIAEKNKVFVVGLPELLKSPMAQFHINFRIALSWVETYAGYLEIVVSALGLIFVSTNKRRIFLLLICSAVPFVVEIFIAKQFFSRYFLFSVIPLTLAFGLVLQEVKNKLVLITILTLVFIPQLTLSKNVVMDPTTAGLHPTEKWQFIYGWPAGYGWKEASMYLRKANPKVVVTEEIWGAVYSLKYYDLKPGYRVISHNYQTGIAGLPQDAYFVFTQMQEPPKDLKLVRQAVFFRPGNSEYISIWKRNEP